MNLGLPVPQTLGVGLVLCGLLLVQSVRVERLKDDALTLRLHDKDQQAKIYNLGRDIEARDKAVDSRAIGEAGDRGEADLSCAIDITSSFQKGVAFGRVIANAKPSPAAAGGKPAPRVVRDYRQDWEAGAFKAAPGPAAGSGVRAPGG